MASMRSVFVAACLVFAPLVACGGDTGDPKVGECEDYCDLITAHCSGPEAQYSDRNSCLATCEAMPLGDATTHAGHTIACRTFQAAAAERDPATTCVAAGPAGAGVCGSICESFCTTAEEICPGVYASVAACLTACAGFAPDPPFDASDLDGDSIECRLYHLTAASIAPDVHCPHIGVTSVTCF